MILDWNQINMLTQEAQALKSAKEYYPDIIKKVQFLKQLPKSQRVLELLNRFITEKVDKIQSKLEAYFQMTDFFTTAFQYEC